jgi:hypothetical protein
MAWQKPRTAIFTKKIKKIKIKIRRENSWAKINEKKRRRGYQKRQEQKKKNKIEIIVKEIGESKQVT